MSTSIDLSASRESRPRLGHAAILYHPVRPRALEEAQWLQKELQGRGVHTVLADGWDDGVVDHICDEQDLIVALGGDGTIIRVTRLAAPHRVPILGVNLGRVGFLAEMTPDKLHRSVDALVNGNYWIEERIVLQVDWIHPGGSSRFFCVNEVAVARGAVPRAIRVRTRLDGEEFMRYTADGVLVVTATGSTAYSLAAGGPVLYPESPDFMLTPLAPHLHIGRSVVVPGGSTITLEVEEHRPAVLSVDGQDEHPLHPGEQVHVKRSDFVAAFVRLGPRHYFYEALADRLQ